MAITKKQSLIKIGAIFMCFFSLFACMSAALAWFYEGKLVGADNTQVAPNAHDVHANFYLYK